MIEWFDADKFLPGRMVDEVLVRLQNDGEPWYAIAEYGNGHWSEKYVTHWAHINEPFE